MKKILSCFFCLTLLTSCAEVASTIVESSMQSGLQSAQSKHPRTKADDKAITKKGEQLMKEGKCPSCGGMGKSPDGKYTCEMCNGTGKYNDNK